MYTLSVLAIFKNESMVLDEWIEHHLWQGVEHFYLINNGSTDDSARVLLKYIEKGVVTLYDRPSIHKQKVHYNEIYKLVRNTTKWLMIIDIDEYMFNVHKGKNLIDYLNNNLRIDRVAGVYVPWKLFGSSGFIDQPYRIRTEFTKCRQFQTESTKGIVFTERTPALEIHFHHHDGHCYTEYHHLQLNHYQIMSEEYFRKVKMSRGSATGLPVSRDWKYFDDHDWKESEDILLKEMVIDQMMGK